MRNNSCGCCSVYRAGCGDVGVQRARDREGGWLAVRGVGREGCAVAEELKAICDKNGWPRWDMFNPAYDWLFKTGLPSEFYSRDYVHSGEFGKQLIARIALAYFIAAAL